MIRFEVIDATFNLRHKNAIKNWIKEILEQKNREVGDVNYLFSNDQYVLEVNRQYLGHDFYTDIITFDTSDYDADTSRRSSGDRRISADIVISLDTVRSNAVTYSESSFSQELYRVMIHGVLHLVGFDDQTPEQAEQMRSAENQALSLLKSFQIPDDQIY